MPAGATHLMESGVELPVVQYLLDHSSLKIWGVPDIGPWGAIFSISFRKGKRVANEAKRPSRTFQPIAPSNEVVSAQTVERYWVLSQRYLCSPYLTPRTTRSRATERHSAPRRCDHWPPARRSGPDSRAQTRQSREAQNNRFTKCSITTLTCCCSAMASPC
jgi:hypothetical protein